MFSKQFLVDAIERIVASFVGGVVATELASTVTPGIHATTGHDLLIGGLAAAVATAKALFASLLPTEGASLLPKPREKRKRRPQKA